MIQFKGQPPEWASFEDKNGVPWDVRLSAIVAFDIDRSVVGTRDASRFIVYVSGPSLWISMTPEDFSILRSIVIDRADVPA